MDNQVQEAFRTPNRHDEKRMPSFCIIVKLQKTQNKESILKAVRKKHQVTYKGKSIRVTAGFSTEILN